ncbi:glycosyltransferase [Natronorubrum texcoconense]|uniref:Glycosyl transferase family 2 n=1 Tax=Natronorubrum texcoconense TaxID=1095776 RepID=A0A1G9E823_9EURY|nr:glycosyltransferase [Natronorubrum texcoconense]SDK72237.1 Glycosyl transferase family 2 [Natronorubrum texcoconense]
MSPAFSVLMPVYHGDDPSQLAVAVRSVIDQSVRPDEIVIVEDGPLTRALDAVLDAFQREYGELISRYRLRENVGIGNALRAGVQRCEHELVARMDADDISVPNRFERQLAVFDRRPDVDAVGGYIAEFDDDPADLYARRIVPTNHASIAARARFRNPMNHITVMARRGAILEAGNYRDFLGMEDYDLWVRMLSNGSTFANVPAVLAKARIDRHYTQRGGIAVARAEARLQWTFYRAGFVDAPILLYNLLTRVPLRLLPRRIRGRLIARYTRTPP